MPSITLNGTDWRLLPMMPREWEWRKIWEVGDELTPALWIPAQVPGLVQDDAHDAGLIPDHAVDFNSRDCEWTSERDWVYLKEFDSPEVPEGGIVRLRFEGVDFECHVYLNGAHLGDHVGMYDAFEFDVTGHLSNDGPNRLVVICEHAPWEHGQIGRTSEVRLWKARFAYDWDWCTRLIPIGIYDSVSLEVTGPAHIRDLQTYTELTEDCASASIGVSTDIAAPAPQNLTVRTRISHEGETVAASETPVLAAGEGTEASTRFTIDGPDLWWPNGYGDQPLYETEVALLDEAGAVVDERSVTFGIRRVRAIQNDNPPEGALPYCLEVNGKRVFIKGWNWGPIQQLYGRPAEREYDRWIGMAAHANANLLRIWGGGLLEKPAFYDACDRLGIMVWQEFIQSSSGIDNRPAEDPEFLSYIKDQAEGMIPRRRNHPSLVIWTGGNELMRDNWTPLDDTHPALGLLHDCVSRIDPGRIWYPTSAAGPVANASPAHAGKMQDVHGPWQYQGPTDHYLFYNSIDPLLHSEYGVEGAANLSAMRRIASDKASLWPPDESNPLWLHHGSWWIQREMMTRVFGEIDDLETYVRASQLLQAEGLRYGYESHRRRKWRCGGTMPWQFNESWPNLSCTNSFDYYGHPRPAFWWAKLAYEPFHVSAKYDKLGWEPGETLYSEIWLNNSLTEEKGCEVTWQFTDLAGAVLGSGEAFADAPWGSATKVTDIAFEVPGVTDGVFILTVRASAPSGASSANWYLFACSGEPVYAPLLRAPQTELEVERDGALLALRNVGSVWALCVQVEAADGETWITPSENYVMLAPDEEKLITVEPADVPVEVSGLNFAPGLV